MAAEEYGNVSGDSHGWVQSFFTFNAVVNPGGSRSTTTNSTSIPCHLWGLRGASRHSKTRKLKLLQSHITRCGINFWDNLEHKQPPRLELPRGSTGSGHGRWGGREIAMLQAGKGVNGIVVFALSLFFSNLFIYLLMQTTIHHVPHKSINVGHTHI